MMDNRFPDAITVFVICIIPCDIYYISSGSMVDQIVCGKHSYFLQNTVCKLYEFKLSYVILDRFGSLSSLIFKSLVYFYFVNLIQ